MPARHVLKEYKPGGYYHIYNRGIDKRTIFTNKWDYRKFTFFLIETLGKVDLIMLCYCLLPNHFHFLIQQGSERAITTFMRSLCTRYVLYFNYVYGRSGRLFQGPFRARIIRTDSDLLKISAYIHNNPRKHNTKLDPKKYGYSSFSVYMGKTKCNWIHTGPILFHFKLEDYENFVDRTQNLEDGLGVTL